MLKKRNHSTLPDHLNTIQVPRVSNRRFTAHICSQVSHRNDVASTSTPSKSGLSVVEVIVSHSSPRPNVTSSTSSDIFSPIDTVKSWFLPQGFPSSTTPDYLPYQLWSVPTHIMGWLSVSLTTSSLLKAVGVSAGAAGTAASAAAIKWIIKDGLGSFGRVLVGGRLGREFDQDPRKYRMYAEFLTTAGLLLEICTSLYPSQFLLLASVGNFTKAVGKGMGKPTHTVIMNHFAVANNVGACAAKEEVWEVTGQLAGFACSVVVLQTIGDSATWSELVTIWAVIQGTHILLRFQALASLRFQTLNPKRSALLAQSHVQDKSLPSMDDVNLKEAYSLFSQYIGPEVNFGVGLEDALGSGIDTNTAVQLLAPLYATERYMLVWRDGCAHVMLEEGFGKVDLLRALWQAMWLHHNSSAITASSDGGEAKSAEQLLPESIAAMQASFDDFAGQLQAGGWKLDTLDIKVGGVRVTVVSNGL